MTNGQKILTFTAKKRQNSLWNGFSNQAVALKITR